MFLFVTPPLKKLGAKQHKDKNLAELNFGARAIVRIDLES